MSVDPAERGLKGGRAATANGFFATWKWALAAGAMVVWVVMTAIVHEDVWFLLGVWNLDAPFMDLAAIFAAGEAWMVGRDVYLVNPFDPLGRPHVYGPWWLVTGPLGFTVPDVRWAGALLVLGFVVVVLAMVRPRTPRAAVATALFLLSGPVLIGLERANNDLVVVILLAAAAWLIGRGQRAARLGGAVLVLAAGLKIYPVVALTALGATRGKIRWVAAAVAGLACVATFLIWRDDFAHIVRIAPRPMTVFSYGVRTVYYSWVGFEQHRAVYAPPLFLLGAAGAWLVWRARAALWDLIPLEGGKAAAYVAGASAWVFCFLANTNYPYRVVLLALCLPLWLREEKEAGEDVVKAGRRMALLVILAGWMAVPKMWWADAGEAGILVKEAGKWVIGISGADQAMWLTLTVAMGISLLGWARRRLSK